MNQITNQVTNEATSEVTSEATNQGTDQKISLLSNDKLAKLGIATHMIAASTKIESELSSDKGRLWQSVLPMAIRPGATLGNSWWLFSQWLLCRIGEVFAEDSCEDQVCMEVCTLYELGCNNIEIWQGVTVKIARCQYPDLPEVHKKALAAIAQIAQTAINLLSQARNFDNNFDNENHAAPLSEAELSEEAIFIGKTLNLACDALLAASEESIDRATIYEEIGSQFLHTASLA